MQYVVVHTVRVGQQTIRTPKLVVTDVPEKTSAQAIAGVLEAAGKAVAFSDAGIPWGNHEIKSSKDKAVADLTLDEVETASWEALQSTREIRRVTLRLPAQTYAAVLQAAQRAGMSIQAWSEDVMTRAAEQNTNNK